MEAEVGCRWRCETKQDSTVRRSVYSAFPPFNGDFLAAALPSLSLSLSLSFRVCVCVRVCVSVCVCVSRSLSMQQQRRRRRRRRRRRDHDGLQQQKQEGRRGGQSERQFSLLSGTRHARATPTPFLPFSPCTIHPPRARPQLLAPGLPRVGKLPVFISDSLPRCRSPYLPRPAAPARPPARSLARAALSPPTSWGRLGRCGMIRISVRPGGRRRQAVLDDLCMMCTSVCILYIYIYKHQHL